MSDDRRAASPCWAPWWVEAYWDEHKKTLMEPSRKAPSVEHHFDFSDSFRFFILRTPDTFTNISPFLIEKAITGSIGKSNPFAGWTGAEHKAPHPDLSTPDLPQTVKMAYIRCPVRPYIPNPLRCFQCQRYGHSKNVCRGQPTCPRCGESGHDSADCKKKEQCLNCKGEHPAYSRPVLLGLSRKEITSVKIKDKISYPEARRVVLSRTPVSDFHRKIEEDTLTGDCSFEDDEDLMDIQSGPSTSSSRGGASAAHS
ncbi:CCHC-type domain-containing protein [Trichonephila clavipes]|uniref:CCHC-type domain-containing protein n=1 Tax=Trichonephila clavipes TaxID=2585209 RepID=A0A8X6RKS0_TRICX|nr:CCHC-type domain-containing protein [Trichonephila clavipes]